jgi:cell volume regulation protein A
MARSALPASGLYPLAVLAICVLAYGGAASLHLSGFASVYVAALVLGNADLPHRGATRSFIEGLGWLSQIGLFVMLGLLVSPSSIGTTQVVQAVIAGFLLTAVARPLSVWACTVWSRTPLPDMAFMSWAGLRGAVPIVLATIPLSEGVSGSNQLFHVVFVLVVIDTVITGPTLPWVAKRLGVTVAGNVRDIEIEAAPLERIAADLLQIKITKRSKMSGVEVGELRLPGGASVSLLVREGEVIVPDGRTVLRKGDDVLVVTPRGAREATEARLRAVSQRGRLAHWLD